MGLFGKAEKSEAQKYMEQRGSRVSKVRSGEIYRRKDYNTHTYINGKKSHRSTQNKNVVDFDKQNPTQEQLKESVQNMMSTFESALKDKGITKDNIIPSVTKSSIKVYRYDAGLNGEEDSDVFHEQEDNTIHHGGVTVNGKHYNSFKEAWEKDRSFKVIILVLACAFGIPLVITVFEVIFVILTAFISIFA